MSENANKFVHYQMVMNVSRDVSIFDQGGIKLSSITEKQVENDGLLNCGFSNPGKESLERTFD